MLLTGHDSSYLQCRTPSLEKLGSIAELILFSDNSSGETTFHLNLQPELGATEKPKPEL